MSLQSRDLIDDRQVLITTLSPPQHAYPPLKIDHHQISHAILCWLSPAVFAPGVVAAYGLSTPPLSGSNRSAIEAIATGASSFEAAEWWPAHDSAWPQSGERATGA